MRVAFDAQIFLFQKYGGVSRYYYELAKKLAVNKGVEVYIVAPFYINSYIKKCDSINILGCQSIFFHSFKLENRYLQKISAIYHRATHSLKLLIAHFALLYLNPKIIHETYYSRFKMGRKGAIRVLTVYDMIHEKFPEFFDCNSSAPRIKKIAIDRADHIICISESTRQDLIQFLNVPHSKISIVYLGYNPNIIRNEKKSKFADWYIKLIGNAPYIFYVGVRSGYKNFNRLVEAFASSSLLRGKYKLVCFGGGKFSTEERNLFNIHGLIDGSIIQVDGEDGRLNDLYTNASVFVYPSIYEGFGIPPLEAMANNCPVACSNSSSLPEVVGNAAIYFDPHDKGSIARSIEKVINSDVLKEELIKNGRNQISKFSWERCATETQKVYEKVLLEKGLM